MRDVLHAVASVPRKPTPGAQRDGDEVPVVRCPFPAGEPLPSSWRTWLSSRPRKVHIRAGVEIEKYATPAGCDAILTGGQAKSHCTACRERIMTVMQHDEKACEKSPSGGGPQETTCEFR